MANRPALTVVIAAFNEARRLDVSLRQLRRECERRAQRWQVVVVDDGSADRTSDMAQRFDGGESLDLEVINNPRNRGKGFCARRGMIAARADLVLLTDADLSTPIDEIDELMPWFERGYDIVIGSRDLPDSILDPPQPLYRRMMGLTYRTVRRHLMLPHLRDTQCGFKMYRLSAAQKLFPLLDIDRFGFDCEILGLAELHGFRVKEQAVRWRDDPDSRVRPIVDSLRMALDLLLTRRRLRHLAEDLHLRR